MLLGDMERRLGKEGTGVGATSRQTKEGKRVEMRDKYRMKE